MMMSCRIIEEGTLDDKKRNNVTEDLPSQTRNRCKWERSFIRGSWRSGL